MSANRRLNSRVHLPARLILAMVATLVALFAPAIASAQYTALTVTLSDSSVPPGTVITVTVEGCDVGTDVIITIDGTTTSVTAACEAASGPAAFRRPAGVPPGSASAELTAPTTPGTYTVRAAGIVDGVEQEGTAVLTVEGAAGSTTTVPGGALPSTGSDTWRITTSAAAVLGIGFAAVLVSRRRRLPTS